MLLAWLQTLIFLSVFSYILNRKLKHWFPKEEDNQLNSIRADVAAQMSFTRDEDPKIDRQHRLTSSRDSPRRYAGPPHHNSPVS